MNPRSVIGSCIATMLLSGYGCGQQPGTPPTSPKPKTSDARSAPMLAVPAAAAREQNTPHHVSTAVDNVEDAVVTGKVRAALLGTQDVQATEINVETEKGIVHLSGVVETNSDLDRAVYLAGQVEGVKAVQHRLRVKPS